MNAGWDEVEKYMKHSINVPNVDDFRTPGWRQRCIQDPAKRLW